MVYLGLRKGITFILYLFSRILCHKKEEINRKIPGKRKKNIVNKEKI